MRGGTGEAKTIANYAMSLYEVSGARAATVTRRLYEALTDIQYGRVPDPYGWSVPLEAEAATAV